MKTIFFAMTLVTASYVYSMGTSDSQLPDQNVVVDGTHILVYAENNSTAALEVDLTDSVGTNKKRESFDINKGYAPNYDTPLMHAARNTKSKEFIKLLIKYGANINQANEQNGYTALHNACNYNSCPEIIEELVKQGASVNAVTKGGFTPLHLAMSQSYNPYEITETLLKAINGLQLQ